MAKILVIDDEPSIRLTLTEFLSAEGHQTIALETAEPALDLLRREPFDVVVCDILLPRLKGTEFLPKLHAEFPDVRAILITGQPSVDTVAAGIRGGAFDYLVKPIHKEDILRVVSRAAKEKALDDLNRRLAEENRSYQEHLERLVDQRTADLALLSRKIIAVQEEECARISQDLHDDLGQDLLALKLQLQGFFRALGELDGEQTAVRDQALACLGDVIDKTRQVSHGLSPIALRRLGLEGALAGLVRGADADADGEPEIRVAVAGLDACFPGRWDFNLYRFVQEGVTNARKHAGARLVTVAATVRPGNGVRLTVTDDGKGFDPSGIDTADSEQGLGLHLLQERAALLGGRFEIASAPGAGTTLTLDIPPRPETGPVLVPKKNP